MAKIYQIGAAALLLSLVSCSSTQVSYDTIVKGDKVYKIVDNELMFVGDLGSADIKNIKDAQPKPVDLGVRDLGFYKPGVKAALTGIYRGATFYYRLKITGIETTPSYGSIEVEFFDEHKFIISSTTVPVGQLVRLVDDAGRLEWYEYNGKADINPALKSAISGFSIGTSMPVEK
ncbi:hypothetical protein [Mucilaginibacter pedocola]|uniref:Uncharacterized protein n=1 Tax=Mucilaginibacter pedocola TaxID=1792845 RepID=A0A1S9P834_9SPHI|nr:hypothetical protein [Mucilaginibacter pedocola]OOQ57115.1 hypothetical protein BC343_16470 [Mucilaginibacter pedocola]